MGKLTPELKRVLKLQYPDDIVIEVRGEIVHFNPTEENMRKLDKAIGFEVFKEETGNRNWVLYNPKNFKVAIKIYAYLICISEENLEIPINCSSCNSMFQDFKFNNKDTLKNFDTSGIKDMSYMFAGCAYPEQFSLGDKFNTSRVEDMKYMFANSKLPNGFSLGNKFDTSNVRDMEYMFFRCTFPEQFSLGDRFNTSNAKCMSKMFMECTLPNDFYLDDKFDISNAEYAYNMFDWCKLPEGKTAVDFSRSKPIIEWLKSRNPKNSNNTSNTNFFN